MPWSRTRVRRQSVASGYVSTMVGEDDLDGSAFVLQTFQPRSYTSYSRYWLGCVSQARWLSHASQSRPAYGLLEGLRASG